MQPSAEFSQLREGPRPQSPNPISSLNVRAPCRTLTRRSCPIVWQRGLLKSVLFGRRLAADRGASPRPWLHGYDGLSSLSHDQIQLQPPARSQLRRRMQPYLFFCLALSDRSWCCWGRCAWGRRKTKERSTEETLVGSRVQDRLGNGRNVLEPGRRALPSHAAVHTPLWLTTDRSGCYEPSEPVPSCVCVARLSGGAPGWLAWLVASAAVTIR